MTLNKKTASRASESGNVFFYILIAIVLIAAVTAAMRSGGNESANIDAEQATIQATQMRSYASDLEKGVAILMQNGLSESDLRFAHPDAPSTYGDIGVDAGQQLFSRSGGGVEYKLPPAIVNRSAPWEFVAATTFPLVGSGTRGDLAAVLPNVDKLVCEKLNALAGFTAGTQPLDDGTCVYSGPGIRFNSANQYNDSAPNTVDASSYGTVNAPATQACVQCDDDRYYFYHVLMSR